MTKYESKAIITTIKAASRASVKIRDNYYTVEYCEERTIPDVNDVDIESERALLWETCNNECDNQINDILQAFSSKKC
jgi:hypothetical protein